MMSIGLLPIEYVIYLKAYEPRMTVIAFYIISMAAALTGTGFMCFGTTFEQHQYFAMTTQYGYSAHSPNRCLDK